MHGPLSENLPISGGTLQNIRELNIKSSPSRLTRKVKATKPKFQLLTNNLCIKRGSLSVNEPQDLRNLNKIIEYQTFSQNEYEVVLYISPQDVVLLQTINMKKSAHKTRRQLQAEKEKLAKQLVDRANALLNPLGTLECFQNYRAKDGALVKLSCCRVKDLSAETVSWVLDLMERNMKQMYEQSAWGWDLVAKQKELLEPAAWYLVASCDDKPIGFSHFRFDTDYGVEVLYCYEIQLEPSTRRRGLGRFMMQALESMAYQAQMQKVVMTVFKHNPAAISFSHSLGYRLDSTNPYTTEKLHYIILSKQNLCLVNPKAD